MSTPKSPNKDDLEDALGKALRIYRNCMRPFIVRHLRKVPGEKPEDLIAEALSDQQADQFWTILDKEDDIESAIDFSYFPAIIQKNWLIERNRQHYGFNQQFDADMTFQSRLWLIRGGRNIGEHEDTKVDSEFVRIHLFLIGEVLNKINEPDRQSEVEKIRIDLFSDDTAERLAEAEKRLKDVEAENAGYKKSLSETKNRLTDAKSKNSEYKEDTTELSRQVDQKENRINKLLKQQKEAKAQNEKSKKDLARTKRDLEKSKAAQTDYKQRLETIAKELKATEKEARTSEENLKTTSNQLNEAVDEWMASLESLTATRKLFTVATIGSQEVQAIFPSFEIDAAVRILDRRNTEKKSYLLNLLEQKQPTIIYVQSEAMVDNLLKLVGPEKDGVIEKYDERTSEGKEREILEKLENRELIAVVSNTTLSTLASSHCVEHFVFCHLTPSLDEFFKRCQPAFASEKDSYLHLIYNSKQDVQYLDTWLDQKYPAEERLKNLYRELESFVGVNGNFINLENLYSKLDIERLSIETGISIFEELQLLERNEESIKLLAPTGKKLDESEIYNRGEKLKEETADFRAFQLEHSIEQIWEEILGALDIDLEKYLLKSNVASGEAEVDAKTVLEEEETSSYKASSTDSEVNNPNDIDDEQSVTKQPVTPSKSNGKWTMEEVRNSLSEEVRDYQKKYPEERRNIFYRRIAEIQNLIEAEGWRLKPPKLNKESCSFQLMDKGITRVRIIFGVLLDTFLPHANLVDRNGEKIPDLSIKSNPPRIFAPITEEEAKQLERQHGCEFWGITERKIYYNIPDDITELRPVLEFAYNKHRGQ